MGTSLGGEGGLSAVSAQQAFSLQRVCVSASLNAEIDEHADEDEE